MLVKQSATEHQAHCERCRRDSPIVTGTEAEAAKRLEDLGWMQTVDQWRCPVCCARTSGDFKRFER